MRIRGDATTAAPDRQPAPVRRFDSSPWRDPRLIAGVLLVLVSSVLGGWAISTADKTVGYWATRGAVRAGDPVERADLVAVQAKVPGRTARGLLRTSEALPARLADLRWATDARAGTLVTSAALEPRGRAVELPISVAASGIPSDLRSGDRVDVWAVPDRTGGTQTSTRARRVLTKARVVSRSTTSGVSAGPGVTVVVDVSGMKLDAALMSALATQRLTIVRVS